VDPPGRAWVVSRSRSRLAKVELGDGEAAKEDVEAAVLLAGPQGHGVVSEGAAELPHILNYGRKLRPIPLFGAKLPLFTG
jgi:hypothetical protein